MREEALKHLESWEAYKSSKDILMWALDARIIIRRLVAELDEKDDAINDIVEALLERGK